MSRDLGFYLTDIVHSIDKIQKYTSGMTHDDLLIELLGLNFDYGLF